MTAEELNKLMRGLILPEKFVKCGRLAYYIITHDTGASILIGIYIDKSIDKDSFFVQYFAQCLYIPFSTYVFSLGDRIGEYWGVNDSSNINLELQKFDKFNNLNTFNDFIPYLEQNKYYGAATGKNQYFAYTYFILKQYDKAIRHINEIQLLRKHTNPEWFVKDIKNADLIKECIVGNNYESGINLLLKWQTETIKSIKLKL